MNTRKIKITEFRESSTHISGLVFRVDAAKKISKNIKNIIDSNSAAYVYPQVLLTSMLLSTGDGYWYSKVLCRQKEHSQNSSITNPDGNVYYGFEGRFQQALGFLEFFDSMQDVLVNDIHKKKLNSIKSLVTNSFVASLRSGLAHTKPELVPAFDRGCLNVVLNQYLVFRALRKLLRVFC